MTPLTRIEQKYALTKLAPGDYLLPSNDGCTIWRIALYEDGPSHGLTAEARDRDYWGIWKWERPVDPERGGYVDTADWNRWEMYGGHYDTRALAIQEALRVG